MLNQTPSACVALVLAMACGTPAATPPPAQAPPSDPAPPLEAAAPPTLPTQVVAAAPAPPADRLCTQTQNVSCYARIPGEPALWMQRNELTVRQFYACVQSGTCKATDSSHGAALEQEANGPDGDMAIGGLTHQGAKDLCAFQASRLPTDEEWLRAAQAGDGRDWPWGDFADCPVLRDGDRIDERYADEGVMEACSPLVARLSPLVSHAQLKAVGDEMVDWPAADVRTFCTDIASVPDAELIAQVTARQAAIEATITPVVLPCVHDRITRHGDLRYGHPQGLLGLVGNLAEWTDTPDPADPTRMRLRGGSYATGPDTWRLTHVASLPPASALPDVGARCVWNSTP